jgi:hypothetical protein
VSPSADGIGVGRDGSVSPPETRVIDPRHPGKEASSP